MYPVRSLTPLISYHWFLMHCKAPNAKIIIDRVFENDEGAGSDRRQAFSPLRTFQKGLLGRRFAITLK